MKKCAFIVALVCMLVSVPAFAMDVMLGAKAGYYAWRPFYKELGASGMDDIDYGAGVPAGPIVSLLFSPDLTFSLAGLAGRQSTHWQAVFSDFDASQEVSGGYYFDVLRVDVDSALSYRLSDNFKLFAGYKLLYLSADYKHTEIRTSIPGRVPEEIDIQDVNIVTPFHGPALGVGISLPLSDRVFVSTNASMLYMVGILDQKRGVRYVDHNDGSSFDGLERKTSSMMPKLRTEQFGLNVEPAIGFNPGEGMPVISLGLRFQWLRVHFTERNEDFGGPGWMNDYLYGVFVSAVYMF